jgi:hypothetical protein
VQHDKRGELTGGILLPPEQRNLKNIEGRVPGFVQGPEQELADDRVKRCTRPYGRGIASAIPGLRFQ